MKKLMVVICLLGLSAVTAAAHGSPVLQSFSNLFQRSGNKESKATETKDLSPELKQAMLMAKADQAVVEAEKELKELFEQENLNTQVSYQDIVKWHQRFVSIFKNEKNEDAHNYYQHYINDLEIFVSFMRPVDKTVRRNIEAILNHPYYFPNYKSDNLVSLREAALGFSQLSVKTYGPKTAGLSNGDQFYFKEMQPATEVNKKALRLALRADNELRKLMPNDKSIVDYHQYLIGAMTSPDRKEFVYQDVETALENLADAVQSIKDEALAKQVISVLNHAYYFPKYKYNGLASLKEIAKNVDGECRIIGNGFDSAGLQDNGFYKNL